MIHKEKIPEQILSLLEEKLQEKIHDFEIPPPAFLSMQGEFVEFDLANQALQCRFPVLEIYQNPYGNMQGGIISAAIDNTIGPLSMLVAPPNFTRHLEVKYKKVISPETDFLYITAQLIEQKKRQLFFQADVNNKDGETFASAKATHWII